MKYAVMEEGARLYVCVSCLTNSACLDPCEFVCDLPDRFSDAEGMRLLIVDRSDRADVRLRLFHSNGEADDACDSALSSAATFIYEHALLTKSQLAIETDFGVISAQLECKNDKVKRVHFDLGTPVIHLPVAMPLTVLDTVIELSRVLLVGQMHCVTFVHRVTDTLVSDICPHIWRGLNFAAPTHVDFVEASTPASVTARAWRRSSGELAASPIAACAVGVVGTLVGRTEREVIVRMRRGTFSVDWPDRNDGHVFFSGCARQVASGTLEEKFSQR